MAFTTELPALIALQALHAGSFAACHLGAMAFIQRALPPAGVALGQSIYYALGTGATQERPGLCVPVEVEQDEGQVVQRAA